MAAGGYREFLSGETLTEDLINDYLMQGVLVFAGTAARGSAIGTAVEGQFAFLKDVDKLTYYSGSAWEEFSTSPGAAVVTSTTGSATLGTVVSGGTTYNTYSFTGDGSIVFGEEGLVELLLVGAGGGGGVNGLADVASGGAGGGQVLSVSQAFVSAGTVTVTIGAGGAVETAGEGSSFGTFQSVGGGRGGSSNNAKKGNDGGDGANGGGGASGQSVTNGVGGITVLASPGYTGGTGNASATLGNRAAGGGAGASADGGNAGSGVGGNGGAGLASSITGSSVTYAGGGGGATRNGTSEGTGGAGGGGAAGVAGTANTGGGGGDGAAGGSGLVIVRVAV